MNGDNLAAGPAKNRGVKPAGNRAGEPGTSPDGHPGGHPGSGSGGKDPRVGDLLQRETRWRAEFSRLRSILLDRPLEETVKWGQPCYTHGGKNVVLIHGFKDYCALLFFNSRLTARSAMLRNDRCAT